MADIVKSFVKIIGGITLIVVALWIGVVAPSWGRATIAVVEGGILITLILAGIVLGLIGFTGLKD